MGFETRSSAIADKPRDALCLLKSCQQPNEDAVVMRSQRDWYRQILWSSAVFVSAHHHAKFVLEELRQVKPVKFGV